MNLVDELEKLNELYRNGALSDEEFAKAKEALINKQQSAGQKIKQSIDDVSGNNETWGLLIHITQFCGYVLPLAGWIVPLMLWLIKRNESHVIDLHGRVVVNWLISELIYAIVFGFLCIIVIGIPFLVVLGVLAIIYPIIGAVKAGSGEVWHYPGSIRFLSLED
jgi:uncharacterized Tic20 family protein